MARSLYGVYVLVFLVFALLISSVVRAQQFPSREPLDTKLPDGKSQREAILKADHERSLKDVDELGKLVEEVKIELEKNDRHVVSMTSIKKLDDIEKIAKRIKSRLKRY